MAPIKHATAVPATGTLLRAAALFAASLVFLLVLGTHPGVRNRTEKLRLAALLTWEQAPLAGAQVQAPAPAPTAGDEASYQFVHYSGQGSTLETRSCGKIQGLRAKSHHHKLVVDALPFNNEVDLLSFRMLELWDVVDLFVVIESPLAFSGMAKPLHFGDALCTRFAPFARKIVHVVMNTTLYTHTWGFEGDHREVIKPTGRLLGLQPDDLLLTGDADEFPYGTAVMRGVNVIRSALTTYHSTNQTIIPVVDFDLSLYYWSFYHKIAFYWGHLSKIYPYGALDLEGAGVTALRSKGGNGITTFDNENIKLIETIPNAGVHCSYCFPLEGLLGKVRSFSHADVWSDKTDEQIKEKLKTWVKEHSGGWTNTDGPPRDPKTNPDLYPLHPDVREGIIEWTEALHKRQLEE